MLVESDLRNKLKNLRLQKGLTEAEAAARLGKASNSYINRIENGPTKINIEILDELCALYQVNPADLFRSKDQGNILNARSRGFFEKAVFRGAEVIEEPAKAKIKELLPILNKIGKIQALLDRKPLKLESISSEFEGLDLRSDPLAKDKAKKAASRLRELFQIDKNSPIDIVLFCWRHLNIPICGLDLGQNCWGLQSSDKFGNPLILYSNVHKFDQRNIFTIAHEIGHYLFSHDYLSIDCENTENEGDSGFEDVADAFAQELLVPSDVFREVYDELGLSLVDEIKPHHVILLCQHFKVSFFMMVFCLKQARKISFSKYQELKKFCNSDLARESSALGYYPETYFSHVKPLKQQLRELVLIALRKELIGFFEASQMLDEPTSDLKAAL